MILYLLIFVLINWAAPIILSGLYAIVFTFEGSYIYAGTFRGAPVFFLNKSSAHARLWGFWAGFALFGPIFLRDPDKRILKHEYRHVQQALVLGLLQQAIYWLSAVFIYFFRPQANPYIDNPFEIDSRRYAGQTRPGADFADGDRWPWW